MLTDKCKIEFVNWTDNNGISSLGIPEIYLNTVIIEWLDSVGIYISIEAVFDRMLGYNRGFQVHIYQDGKQPITLFYNNDCFETRKEAQEQAILKANEIFNKLNN